MLISLPLLGYLLLMCLARHRGAGWRQSSVIAAFIWGLIAIFLTETLSLVQNLRLIWIALAALFIARRADPQLRRVDGLHFQKRNFPLESLIRLSEDYCSFRFLRGRNQLIVLNTDGRPYSMLLDISDRLAINVALNG